MLKSEFTITMSSRDDLKGFSLKDNHAFTFEEDDNHVCTLADALEVCLQALKCYGYQLDEDKLVEIIQDNIDFDLL